MLVGQALGREDRATQVVADVKARFEKFRTDHADAAGETAITASGGPDDYLRRRGRGVADQRGRGRSRDHGHPAGLIARPSESAAVRRAGTIASGVDRERRSTASASAATHHAVPVDHRRRDAEHAAAATPRG